MDKLAIRQDMNIMEMGEVFVKSGFFKDLKDASQAIVKILAGQELGFGPFASMRSIHIVQGKPTIGADLIASCIKQSERYDFEVKQHDNKGCVLIFWGISKRTGKWEILGESSFDESDAKTAGLTGKDNYKHYARNMFFARAISNGCAWYCPDVFEGRVYTPGEIPESEEEMLLPIQRVTKNEPEDDELFGEQENLSDEDHETAFLENAKKQGIIPMALDREKEKAQEFWRKLDRLNPKKAQEFASLDKNDWTAGQWKKAVIRLNDEIVKASKQDEQNDIEIACQGMQDEIFDILNTNKVNRFERMASLKKHLTPNIDAEYGESEPDKLIGMLEHEQLAIMLDHWKTKYQQKKLV